MDALNLGVVYVFGVSSAIAMFELLLFLFGVAPKNDVIVRYYAAHLLPVLPRNENLTDLLAVLAEREAIKDGEYNNHLIAFIGFLVCALLQGMCVFGYRVRVKKLLVIPCVSAAMTTFCILAFLVLMYFFALEYRFSSNEEVQQMSFDLIRSALL